MGRGAQTQAAACQTVRRPPGHVKHVLYRAGDLAKPEDYDVSAPHYEAVEQFKPAGRAGRLDGLFCSVSLKTLKRWYSANLLFRLPSQPHEIRYHGPEPYAYPISLWERASSAYENCLPNRPDMFEQAARAYWEAGVPLSEYLGHPERFTDEIWDPEDVEVLIDPTHITSARGVSDRRIFSVLDEFAVSQLKHEIRMYRGRARAA